jgi:3-hydroxyacyl-[acyl-carrier-protein] dehydratase
MPPAAHLDPASLDLNRIVADTTAIEAHNPQRFEMMQVTAIVLVDQERGLIAGYKDVRDDEFWCRGHMPGYPLLPGVIMMEAAAQLCSYYTRAKDAGDGSNFIALGGLDNARFRAPVRPGDRLILIAKQLKDSRRQTIFNTQGFVGTTMVFEADVIGMYFSYPKADGDGA